MEQLVNMEKPGDVEEGEEDPAATAARGYVAILAAGEDQDGSTVRAW